MKLSSIVSVAIQICSTWSLGRDRGVSLSSIKTLTLRSGQMTTGKRSKVPQLKCVGGSAKGLYEVEALQCRNLGGQYSNDDIQWSCTATQLPDSFQLGSTDVICEGFSHPDDPNVTPGSCGVEYTLHLTELGEKRYSGFARVHKLRHGSTWFSKAFNLLFVGMLVFFAYRFYLSCTQPNHRSGGAARRPGGWGGFFGGGGAGGGGGGNGGDHGNPPPPYTRGKQTDTSQPAAPAAGMSPWAAAGLGAAGYMLGRMTSGNTRQREDPYQQRSSMWAGNPSYTSSSFGTGFGGGYRDNDEGSSDAGSSSGNMGAMRSSTGFGGTRRR